MMVRIAGSTNKHQGQATKC